MTASDRETLLVAADHAAERARQRERDDQQQEDLDPVRPAGGVLERVRGVDVVEAAAVGAELLDGFLAGDRPARNGLLRAGDRGHHLVVVVEVLDGPAGDQDRSRRRTRSAAGCAACRGPDRPRSCPAHRFCCGRSRAPARSPPPCRRRRTRSSAPPGRPSAPGDPGRLAGVRLPVGVGDEADRGVPGQRRGHRRGRVVTGAAAARAEPAGTGTGTRC